MMELKHIFDDSDEDEEPEEEPLPDPEVEVMDELVDEVTLGLCFEVHRACKLGTFMLDETDGKSLEQYAIVTERGVDVFGQVPMKKQVECVCPSCSRNLAASRFAPHLEKCMGMGRNSSRIASRRIANSGKKDSDNESDGDNDNDNDWSYLADKRGPFKKLKKDKYNNSPRRTKSGKLSKNGSNADLHSLGRDTPDSAANTPTYELLSHDERKLVLQATCGVISEHTKKMCTRSARCPQHSDEQRKGVRQYLLSQGSGLDNADEVHVDIDTYDDTENQSLRDALQWEAVSNPSPADSNSTTNSTSSRKRKPPKNKKKISKTAANSSSRGGTPTNMMYDFS